MCPSISPDLPGTIDRLSLPEWFRSPLVSYSEKLIRMASPECIVLYGSLARGTYTKASDIDLVVVSRYLPDSFFDRLAYLQGLNDCGRAIDAFAYTPEEFRDMLRRGHVTALDALADGIPVHGEPFFAELRAEFQDMVRRGLRRSICSWVLPTPSASE